MKERSVTTDITDALFELLKTKKLPQITVTGLIKMAGGMPCVLLPQLLSDGGCDPAVRL